MAGLVYARKNRSPQISFAAGLGSGSRDPLPACAAVIVADYGRHANCRHIHRHGLEACFIGRGALLQPDGAFTEEGVDGGGEVFVVGDRVPGPESQSPLFLLHLEVKQDVRVSAELADDFA